jgi:hypothetical protein
MSANDPHDLGAWASCVLCRKEFYITYWKTREESSNE